MLLIFKHQPHWQNGQEGWPCAPSISDTVRELAACVWLVPFEVGQTDARSSVLVCEMQPSKMSSV